MADVVDQATRSRMMSNIKGKNTRPETDLRKALHALGFRYKLHDKKLPGRPDIVMPKWKTAVFVHGCFWHRHDGCRYASQPKTRPDFWDAKFALNVARDRRNLKALEEAGWRSIVVWECEIKQIGADTIASRILQFLSSPSKPEAC